MFINLKKKKDLFGSMCSEVSVHGHHGPTIADCSIAMGLLSRRTLWSWEHEVKEAANAMAFLKMEERDRDREDTAEDTTYHLKATPCDFLALNSTF